MNNENTTPSSNDSQTYEDWRQTKHEGMKTSDEVVAEAVLEATGSGMITHHSIIAGEVNEVYSAKTESGQEVIVRIFHGQKAKFYKEQWAFEQCAKKGVPVPKMLLVKSIEAGEKPLEICVESKLPGVSLDKVPEINTREKKIDLLHQIGKILSQVHSIPTAGFGPLDKEGHGKFTSVPDFILHNSYIKKEKILSELVGRPADIQMVVRAYEILNQELTNYTSPPPCLIHNDISPQHIFVDQGKISGLIDMENACGSDPISELARWDVKFGKEFPLKYIIEGYENKELFTGDFEKKLAFWKIYKSLTSLSYNINVNKPSGINKSLKDLRETLDSF